MFRFVGRVEYADGTVEEFRAGNMALAAWEAYANRKGYPVGKGAPATISSAVIAHRALRIQQGVDAWMEEIEGVELRQDGQAVTRAELLRLLGLELDADAAAIEQAVNAALAIADAPEPEAVPPTRPDPSTV